MSNLGRYTKGQRVPLLLVPSSMPDATPIATIIGPDDSTLAALGMPLGPDGRCFLLRLFMGEPYESMGTYRVTYSYFVAGQPVGSEDTFDRIAGGDAGGRVIAMVSVERPEARYVVAQLDSGRVVQGQNPRL
jgi:hypothetical protein